MSKCIDLTGKKFGRLTVIKRADNYITPKGQKHSNWWCKCDCGNPDLIAVLGLRLRRGNTKSCGCFASEIKSIIHKKYNTYNLSGEYGIGYTTKGEEFYFDLEDYDLIKDYCWHIDANGYVATNILKQNKQSAILFMHRLLMKCDNSKLVIDHINHKTFDNKKSNLRIVNNSQNSMNSTLSKNNTSGVTGVYLNKMTNKWVAQINVDGKTKNLGTFENFEDAKRKRKEYENIYYGEYSYENSINI